MKKMMMFYLPSCPYCRRADQMTEELLRQEPKYRAIELERIDESRETALAEQYDYYYVPAYFVGKQRLFSGAPEREDIERVYREALELTRE